MRYTKSLISASLAALLFATHPDLRAAPAAPFPEYQAQYGLVLMGVLSPWGEGGTGQGILVAVVDSGARLGHDDLDANISGNINLVNPGAPAEDDTSNGHGTRVAGLIAAERNNEGIVGVAYGAKLLIIKVTDANQQQNFQRTASGIDLAVANGARIINLSLVNRNDPLVENALQRAVAAGVVVVMAAGNQSGGSPQFFAALAPSLGKLAIAVGALDPNGLLAAYSNQAGSTANNFITAAGTSIVSTTNGGDKAYNTAPGGTSWAAPQVAGALAVMMSLFPNTTTEDIINIIFQTAQDLGAPGIDAVYGHGRLRLDRATAALLPLLIPAPTMPAPSTGGGGGGSGAGIGALALAAALIVAITQRSKATTETLVLDKFARPYVLDLTRSFRAPDTLPRLSDLLNSFSAFSSTLDLPVGADQSMRLSFAAPRLKQPRDDDELFIPALTPTENQDPVVSLALDGALGGGLDYSVNLRGNPQLDFGLLDYREDSPLAVSVLTEAAFSAPYLSFAGQADSISLGYQHNDATRLKLGITDTDDGLPNGRRSEAAMVDLAVQATDRLQLSLRLGQIVENGNLFGGGSGGPLSVVRATTTSAGIAGRYRLSSRFALVAQYTEGYTQVEEWKYSIAQDYSDLRSNAFGIGLMGSSLLRRGDRAGLAVSQPLRVIRGSVDLNVPTGLDADFQITRTREHIDLEPPGSETAVEAYYRLPLRRRMGNFGAHVVYQNEPLHDNTQKDRLTVFTTLRLKF